MPSSTIHLPEDIHKDVKLYAKNSTKSFSAACRILLETALKVEAIKSQNLPNGEQKKTELDEKHIQYSLQSLNVSKEILRCIYNMDSVLSGGSTAEETLENIKQGTLQHISGLMGK